MRCDRCGKNEATFYYKSNINGKVEEKHLCSDCAEKLGYTQTDDFHMDEFCPHVTMRKQL